MRFHTYALHNAIGQPVRVANYILSVPYLILMVLEGLCLMGLALEDSRFSLLKVCFGLPLL